MLTGFSLNLLSQASNGHSNLPRNPTPILVNMPTTFQDDYFLTSFSQSLSHSIPHISTPSSIHHQFYKRLSTCIISLPYTLLSWDKGPSPSYQSPTPPLVLYIPTLFIFWRTLFLLLFPFSPASIFLHWIILKFKWICPITPILKN